MRVPDTLLIDDWPRPTNLPCASPPLHRCRVHLGGPGACDLVAPPGDMRCGLCSCSQFTCPPSSWCFEVGRKLSNSTRYSFPSCSDLSNVSLPPLCLISSRR